MSTPHTRAMIGLAASTQHKRRAFSLIEVLVAFGVLLVLVGLALPRIAATRAQARALTDLTRARNMAQLTVLYADSHRDLPPTLFAPVYVNPAAGAPWQTVMVGDQPMRGAWWTNNIQYHLLLGPPPPIGVALGQGASWGRLIDVGGVSTSWTTDFALAHTLYADPDYWDIDTQAGEGQWRPQPLSHTVFPADKGLVHQVQVYNRPGFERGYPTCCTDEVRSAVVWTDLSTTTEIQARLKPGVPNFWHHGIAVPLPVDSAGAPIDNTKHGIRGRDR